MRFFGRRQRRSGDPAWLRDRPALAAALADPSAEISNCRDAGEALRRRLALWYLGAPIGPLVNLGEGEEKAATADQLIAIAAMHAEAGSLTDAQQHVERALKRDAEVLDRLRFIGLTAGLHAMAPGRFARFAPEAAAAEEFRARYGTFHRLVEANAESICVVGNAPSEVGLGCGALIDAHALVIRFNNYSPDPKHWADYGRKTDIWVRASGYRDPWRRPGERFAHILINPPIYWRTANGQDELLDAALFGQLPEEVPRRLVWTLATRLGAWPSTGLVVLAWLRQILGTLDSVAVFGFTLSDQVDGPRHYYANRSTSKVQHAWAAERAIFDEMLAR
jgi:hypothetical protein